MTHVFHDEIQALLRGEKLQFDLARDGDGWEDLDPELHDHAASHLLSGRKTAYQFRLKPRTVKIGSREVEAPVLDPVKMTHVFFLDTSRVDEQCRFDSIVYNPTANPPNIEQLRSRGLLFASLEDAKAFHDALSELLTGGAV